LHQFAMDLSMKCTMQSSLFLGLYLTGIGLLSMASVAQAAPKLKVLFSSGQVTPGSNQPLAGLNAPSISGNNIVFVGKSVAFPKPNRPEASMATATVEGVYSLFSGQLGLVKQVESSAENNGGGASINSGFSPPALRQDQVAFVTFTNGRSGNPSIVGVVERFKAGKLETIFTCPFVRSVGSRFFYTLDQPVALSGDTVAWVGDFDKCPIVGNSPPDARVVRSRQGNIDVVADGTTVVPGAATLQYGLFATPVLSGDRLLFSSLSGRSPSGGSLFLAQNGQITEVFKPGTTVLPNAPFQANGLCGSDLDGDRIAICAVGQGGSGIYLKTGTTIRPIVTTNAGVPGERRKFAALGHPRLSGGNLLFVESRSIAGITSLLEELSYKESAIYVNQRSGIVKLASIGSKINNKEVAALSVGANPISGSRVVFVAKFTDGSSSLIQADL
jgi:hypothetical protein